MLCFKRHIFFETIFPYHVINTPYHTLKIPRVNFGINHDSDPWVSSTPNYISSSTQDIPNDGDSEHISLHSSPIHHSSSPIIAHDTSSIHTNASSATVSPSHSPPLSTPIIPRYYSRSIKPSTKFIDFVHTYIPHKIIRQIPSPISSESASFVVNSHHIIERKHYNQAKHNPNWIQAMNKEMAALEANETWELTLLPKGKKAIGSKWVYKTKLNPDGSMNRYKARLVAIVYQQIEGQYFTQTFAPVAKLATVRVLIAIVVAHNWPLCQLDVNNAFLHGFLDEEVYMIPLVGYDKAGINEVCKLKKSIYGLKQASRR